MLCVVQDTALLQQQLSGENLFEAFRLQLVRDFERSNLPVAFAQHMKAEYETIVATLAVELRRCDQQSSTGISRLLYNIDISEEQLRKYVHESPDEDRWNAMAQLVVKRVLQKVVIRLRYKDGSVSS